MCAQSPPCAQKYILKNDLPPSMYLEKDLAPHPSLKKTPPICGATIRKFNCLVPEGNGGYNELGLVSWISPAIHH